MTRDRLFHAEGGASFAEVLVAMALTLLGLAGAMGAFQASVWSLRTGTLATRALAMAESRIEVKRSVRWDRLLLDDLNHDGIPDLVMRDDGADGDVLAGDGVYSGSWDQDGVHLIWTVTPSRSGSLSASGHVLITARAVYAAGEGQREVRVGTLRANPVFVGGQ
ncbi:MAG TPA: choice-of-anchor X domain-containing protein [Nitrospiraceae bacterium]|nr:choice-of-anchor X domain-containing protein [Nitrospiraceae bacterium]